MCDLIFDGFGVGEFDGGFVIIDMVKLFEVFFVWVENERYDFNLVGYGVFGMDDIVEFVDYERFVDGYRFVWWWVGEVVEIVGDGNIFYLY